MRPFGSANFSSPEQVQAFFIVLAPDRCSSSIFLLHVVCRLIVFFGNLCFLTSTTTSLSRYTSFSEVIYWTVSILTHTHLLPPAKNYLLTHLKTSSTSMCYSLAHLTTPSTSMYYHPAHLVPTIKVCPTGFHAIASLRNGFDSLGSVQTLARYPHNSDRPRPPNLNRDVPSTLPETVGVLVHNGFSDQITRPIYLLLHIPPPQDRSPNCLLVADFIKI